MQFASMHRHTRLPTTLPANDSRCVQELHDSFLVCYRVSLSYCTRTAQWFSAHGS